MKVKNIVIAQDRYSILGGISTVNKLLGRAFEEAGYNVSYMALFDNTAGHPDALEPDFVVNSGPLVNKTTHNRLVYNNPGPLGAVLAVKKGFTVLWDCYNTFRTRRYLRSFCKDTVVLTSMAKTADYMAKYAQADQKKGIGYIHEFHSGYNSAYRLDEEKTLRKVATSYDSFVTLSEGDAKLFAQWLNRSVDAVPNPVEPLSTEACEKVREIEKKPIIQFVGRYGPEKGLNRILESFAACAADFPEWVLRINGNGLEEEILAVEKYLAQLDPETAQRVELGGVLNAEEVIEHFAESSLAVMASDFEGLPMSFLEAMQVGTPLVSYPSSSALQEMVPEMGYLAEEPSVEALQEQMRLAMSDAQLRGQKSALCREKSRTFSPEYVVRHWEKLFESIHR